MFSIYFTFIHLTSLRFFTKANAFFSEMKFPVAFRRGALAVMSVLAVVVALAAPQAQAAPPTITSFTSSAVIIDSSPVIKKQSGDETVPVSLSADVTLSWELGGGTPTKLALEYRDEKNKLINDEILPVSKTTHTLNLKNHVYRVWLYAENSETPSWRVGQSIKFEVREPLFLSTPGMPAKITDLTSSVDGSDVTLNWKFRSRYPRRLRLVYKKDEDSVSRIEINNFKLSHTLTLPLGRYTFWLQYQNISSKLVRGTLSKSTTVTVRHADAPKIDSFTADLIGDKRVKLDWVLSGGAPTSLTLKYLDGIKKSVPVTGELTHTLSDLDPGQYIFELIAENAHAPAGGFLEESATDTVVVPDPTSTTPTVIDIITGVSDLLGNVTLTWDLKGFDPTSLTLVYNDGSEQRVIPLDVTETSHTFTVSNLNLGLTRFRLHAVNDATGPSGVSVYKDVLIGVLPPTIISFDAEPIGDSKVKLDWVLGGGDPTNLVIFYSETEEWVEVTDAPVVEGKATHTIPNLPEGEHTFRLFAVNAAVSPLGVHDTETVSVVAVARPKIVDFTSEVLGNNKVRLDWVLGGGDPTDLWLSYYSEDGTVSGFEDIFPSDTSHTFTIEAPGEYTFYLVAMNDAAPDPETVMVFAPRTPSWLLRARRSSTSPPCRSTRTKSGWTGSSAADTRPGCRCAICQRQAGSRSTSSARRSSMARPLARSKTWSRARSHSRCTP